MALTAITSQSLGVEPPCICGHKFNRSETMTAVETENGRPLGWFCARCVARWDSSKDQAHTSQPILKKLWYEEPGCLKINLEPGEVHPALFDHELMIIKNIGGQEMGALVPTHALPKDRSWAPVQFAGRRDDQTILHFPVSNDGRPTWIVPEEEFERMLLMDEDPYSNL